MAINSQELFGGFSAHSNYCLRNFTEPLKEEITMIASPLPITPSIRRIPATLLETPAGIGVSEVGKGKSLMKSLPRLKVPETRKDASGGSDKLRPPEML